MCCARRPLLAALTALLCGLVAQLAAAQGTPWIAEPGSGNPSFANQDAAESNARLALRLDSEARAQQFHCGFAPDLSDRGSGGPTRVLAAATPPLPDGQPLFATQFPRFLHPHHEGSFGYRDLLVLGDHETLAIELNDVNNTIHTETWHRTGTRTVAGHLVSVFNPEWDASILRRALRNSTFGPDIPYFGFGQVLSPATNEPSTLFLAMAPPNIGAAEVVRINDQVQYASHVVNIRDDNYDDSVLGPGNGTGIANADPDIARLFYEHFDDAYDTLVFVSQVNHIGGITAYHGTVRNPIAGIGRPVSDSSASWGSRGVLRGYEAYGGGEPWATWQLVLHEQGHQWGDYTDWASLRPALHRGGEPWFNNGHTPMLYPGTTLYGGLGGNVRALRVDGHFVTEYAPHAKYNPLTLYRMGLLRGADLPTLSVFRDQQWKSAYRRPGTLLPDETVEVTVDDLMALDGGARRGPVDSTVRRAILYISRGGLASQFEMDVVNYLAQRQGASSGVTSWNRYPSFAEATGGLASMTTRIHPRRIEPAVPGPDGTCARVGTHALFGVVLDDEFGGCLEAGATAAVSGRLVLEDRADYDRVCLGFTPWEGFERPIIPPMLVCDDLDPSGRFALDVTFPRDLATGYAVNAYAYWPGAPTQRQLSDYTGAIEVLGDLAPPGPVGVLPPLTLGVDDAAVMVAVGGAFRDPAGDALTYRATSSAPHVVTARVAGARLTLTPVGAGTATIEVTATDPAGLSVTQSFRVWVTTAFTDDPIVSGMTPIKAVHFTELRTRIDALRSVEGLARLAWTDPVLRPRVTRVQRVHLLELRAALAEVYRAVGRAAPRWTDASPAVGTTRIRAAHVTELRAAVLALE